MSTRVSKNPPVVATVTTAPNRVNVTSPDRAPIVLPATADAGHPERLAAALRGFLADAFLAGYEAKDAEMRMLDGNDETTTKEGT